MALLSVDNINYYYQDGDVLRYILRDISCSFDRGTFYTVLGESGSGKTTLLALLSALDQPKTGTVRYEGVDIKSIGYDKYRRNNVSIIFQAYNLVPYMTAVENVRVAMSITDNQLPRDLESVAYNLLDYIGISKDRADRTVNKLSGGEQQRVAIARALATNVDVILADEPTGNLDEDMEVEIVQIFKRLAHDHNKCVIVVSHSSQIANESDVVYRLRKGKFETYEFPGQAQQWGQPQWGQPQARWEREQQQWGQPQAQQWGQPQPQPQAQPRYQQQAWEQQQAQWEREQQWE